MTDSTLPPHILEQIPPELLARASASARPLHRSLFRIADAYTRTASLTLDHLKKTGETDFASPVVICATFAVELLLKFFIAVDQPSRKGHEWSKTGELHGHQYSKLWPRIGKAHRSAILHQFAVRTRKPVDEAQFLRILKDLGDDPFVRWRYLYERQGPSAINMTMLGHVVNALGLAAQEATQAAGEEA